MTFLDLLKSMLNYDPETGLFQWRQRKRNPAMAGRIPLSKDECGYIRFSFKGKKYRAHRLAWLYMTGSWPTKEIDHINGVRDDNRWSNLREADRSFNMQNRKGPNVTNSTKFLGVSRSGNKFAAHIKLRGEQQYLGQFESAQEAHAAYVSAKRQLHAGNTL